MLQRLAGAAASSGGTFEWAAALTAPETLTLICVALWNGLVPSAFTTWAQTYGQASVPPSAANVLYSIQPVFNAGLAAIVLHEQLDASELIGGALIVTARCSPRVSGRRRTMVAVRAAVEVTSDCKRQ